MEFSNCKWCGKQLDARNGDECYQCFITRLEVERNPEIARKVLAHLTPLAQDAAKVEPYFDPELPEEYIEGVLYYQNRRAGKA